MNASFYEPAVEPRVWVWVYDSPDTTAVQTWGQLARNKCPSSSSVSPLAALPILPKKKNRDITSMFETLFKVLRDSIISSCISLKITTRILMLTENDRFDFCI